MADIRVKDLSEAIVPGADYYLLTDSATDGVKKVKTTNVVKPSDIAAASLTGVETLTNKTLTAPTITGATITTSTYNGNTWTAGTGTLTLGAGKTATISNTLTFTGTDASSIAFGSGGAVAYQGSSLAQFSATTSAQLAGVISDETGTGALVFATSPTLVTPTLGAASATSINKVAVTAPLTGATLTIADGATLTAPATASVSGTNTGDQTITLTGDVTGSGTGSFAASIGATKVTSAMLNADVFSNAHSWSGVQTFTNPVVGTQTAGDNSTKAASTAFVQAAITASGGGNMLSTNNLNDVASKIDSRRNLNVSPYRVPITSGQALKVFGDSISTGTGASIATKFGWNYLLANRLGVTHNNYAVSGMGSNYATKAAFTNQAAYGRRGEVSAWMAYHNDVYRGGSAAKTLTKIQGEVRSFLANSFLATAVPVSDSSVTKTGTWTSGSAINEKAALLGGSLKYSTTVNDTLSWTFTGDTLVVGLFNSDGVTDRYGTCTIAVDGATSGNGFATFSGDGLSDGISDGAYNNLLTHNAVILRGLGTGSHTVVLKVTVGTNPVYVDYFGTLAAPSACAPVLLAEAPRPNTAGYSLGGGVWSPAAFDAADAAVRSVFNEFYNYPVALVKINEWFNTTTGVSADNEHPNDLGHSQIAEAFNECLLPGRPNFVANTRLAKSAVQSITTGTYNNVTWDTVITDDDALFGSSSRITAKQACSIQMQGYISFASNATGIREVIIGKNGASSYFVATSPALSGDATVCQFWAIVDCNAGDYLEVKAVQSSGGALDIATNSSLCATVVR